MQFKFANPSLALLCAGRQFRWKNPKNIILAMRQFPNIKLTIIGDGPERKNNERLAAHISPQNICFLPTIKNKLLIQQITKSDVVILNTYYHEWSKVMIESMLLKRPLIINKETVRNVEELNRSKLLCHLCNDSPQSYAHAIKMMFNQAYRRKVALRAFRHAWKIANPKLMESQQALLIKKLFQ